MQDQNLPCPRCPQICHSSGELISHLRSKHRLTESEIQALRGRGYFEDKIPTPAGDIAPEHQKAAVRAQAGTALNVPMVFREEKKQVNPPAGWQKTLEGFVYEKLISQTHTIDSIIKKVLKGSVIANHAIFQLYIYTKDVGTFSELQDKERTLEAKLSGYVTGDPEFGVIAQKLYETKEQLFPLPDDGKTVKVKPINIRSIQKKKKAA